MRIILTVIVIYIFLLAHMNFNKIQDQQKKIEFLETENRKVRRQLGNVNTFIKATYPAGQRVLKALQDEDSGENE